MPNSLFYVNPPPKLPLQQIHVPMVPTRQDDFYVQLDPGVDIFFTPENAYIQTDWAPPGSRGTLYLPAISRFYDVSWDKRRELKIDLQVDFTYAGLGGFRVGIAHPASVQSIGIDVDQTYVYFYQANQQGRAQTIIEELPYGEQVSLIRRYHIRHFPGVRDELWVDGAYAYNLTTNLPEGWSGAMAIFYAEAWSDTDGQNDGNVTLYIRYFEFYQER